MIIYSNDKELITTTIGDEKENSKLLPLFLVAESFRGKENRFFKIISSETMTRNFKHLTQEAMAKEARRKFKEITNIHDSLDFYDKQIDVGYRAFPNMTPPAIYTYSMLFPAITEFFYYWRTFNHTGASKRDFLPQYDLSKLFIGMENFKDLEFIFAKHQEELLTLKKTLYEEFPQFAIFCYEIYPYLDLKTSNYYDISKLIDARLLVHELGLDTRELDALLENLDIAKNNSKVLKLIKNTK